MQKIRVNESYETLNFADRLLIFFKFEIGWDKVKNFVMMIRRKVLHRCNALQIDEPKQASDLIRRK